MSHHTIQVRTDDGMCPTPAFRPAGTGPWPGVLMYMDGLGVHWQTLFGLLEEAIGQRAA